MGTYLTATKEMAEYMPIDHNISCVDNKQRDCGTRLHGAAVNGSVRKLKKLIRQNIPVDFPNSTQQTALFCAAYEGHSKAVKYLLKRGANPNERDIEGVTPVLAGVLGGSIGVMKALIQAGGDLRLHDFHGRTLIDWMNHQPDPNKLLTMSNFIEKTRSSALVHSVSEKPPGQKTGQHYRMTKDRSTTSFLNLFRHRSSYAPIIKGKSSTQCLGFGKVYVGGDGTVGASSAIPLIIHTSLTHDPFGHTYNNGPFMVMESMMWNHTMVTVKRLHQDPTKDGVVDLLITEQEYMSKLRHANILLLLGVCQTENLYGLKLVYERVGCGSLFHHLYQKVESLDNGAMSELLRQICDAVVYLHENNLLHCSISSHAIHIVTPTLAKLTNFEYMVENIPCHSNISKSRAVNNKYPNAVYNWMAPEVMGGDCPSEYSDVYSLTAVIWEVLSGAVPWNGFVAEEIKQLMVDERQCVHIDTTLVEEPFDVILKTGLELDPRDRRLSVQRLKDCLAQVFLDQQDVSFRSTATSPVKCYQDIVDSSFASLNTSLDTSARSLPPKPARRNKLLRKVSKVEKRVLTPEKVKTESVKTEDKSSAHWKRSVLEPPKQPPPKRPQNKPKPRRRTSIKNDDSFIFSSDQSQDFSLDYSCIDKTEEDATDPISLLDAVLSSSSAVCSGYEGQKTRKKVLDETQRNNKQRCTGYDETDLTTLSPGTQSSANSGIRRSLFRANSEVTNSLKPPKKPARTRKIRKAQSEMMTCPQVSTEAASYEQQDMSKVLNTLSHKMKKSQSEFIGKKQAQRSTKKSLFSEGSDMSKSSTSADSFVSPGTDNPFKVENKLGAEEEKVIRKLVYTKPLAVSQAKLGQSSKTENERTISEQTTEKTVFGTLTRQSSMCLHGPMPWRSTQVNKVQNTGTTVETDCKMLHLPLHNRTENCALSSTYTLRSLINEEINSWPKNKETANKDLGEECSKTESVRDISEVEFSTDWAHAYPIFQGGRLGVSSNMTFGKPKPAEPTLTQWDTAPGALNRSLTRRNSCWAPIDTAASDVATTVRCHKLQPGDSRVNLNLSKSAHSPVHTSTPSTRSVQTKLWSNLTKDVKPGHTPNPTITKSQELGQSSTVPSRHYKSPLNEEDERMSLTKYRSETHLNMTHIPGADDVQQHQGGSVKDLIHSFQQKLEEHERKQSVYNSLRTDALKNYSKELVQHNGLNNTQSDACLQYRRKPESAFYNQCVTDKMEMPLSSRSCMDSNTTDIKSRRSSGSQSFITSEICSTTSSQPAHSSIDDGQADKESVRSVSSHGNLSVSSRNLVPCSSPSMASNYSGNKRNVRSTSSQVTTATIFLAKNVELKSDLNDSGLACTVCSSDDEIRSKDIVTSNHNQESHASKAADTRTHIAENMDGGYSSESTVPKDPKRFDLEEFYFDDEIRPELCRERHMRLQTTLGLDSSCTPSYQGYNITPSNSNTPLFLTKKDSPETSQGSKSSRSMDDTSYELPQSPCMQGRRESLAIALIESDAEEEDTLTPEQDQDQEQLEANTGDACFTTSMTVLTRNEEEDVHTIRQTRSTPCTGATTTYERTVKSSAIITHIINMEDDEMQM